MTTNNPATTTTTTTTPSPAPSAPPGPEVAPVRPGEDLDWPGIEAYIRANIDLDVVLAPGPMTVLQFPNGSANLTYLVRFGDLEMVLRRPPFGTIAPGAHDMKREHRVLSRLWRHFDRAPRSYLFSDDHSVAGADFFVMERRRGVVIRDHLPDGLGDHENAARRVGFALVDAMADLHALDPTACDLGDLGKAEGFVARQVSGWKSRWDLVKDDIGLDLMDDLAARLAASLPESQRVSFVHNDLKLDNCRVELAVVDRKSVV